MIKISTPVCTSIKINNSNLELNSDDLLKDDDQAFFDSIKGGLDKLILNPRDGSVDSLLKYAKSI